MGKQRSIKSDFQFLSYKIDEINFHVKNNVNALIYTYSEDTNIEMNFAVRDIAKSTSDNRTQCMCGLDIRIIIKDGSSNEIAQGGFGIEGVFLVDGTLENEKEENIVKFQFPTILFPYLRSAVTNILASAGFGSIIFPLINVHNLIANQQEHNPIKIIDKEKN
jgi:preprotein translocase subunit secB